MSKIYDLLISGAGPAGITEYVKVGERKGFQKMTGFFEMPVRFSGEAGDNIRSQTKIGNLFNGGFQLDSKSGQIGFSSHSRENLRRSALERNVKKTA